MWEISPCTVCQNPIIKTQKISLIDKLIELNI